MKHAIKNAVRPLLFASLLGAASLAQGDEMQMLVEWRAVDVARLEMKIFDRRDLYALSMQFNIDGFLASLFKQTAYLNTIGAKAGDQLQHQEHQRITDLGRGVRRSKTTWSSPTAMPTFVNEPPISADPVTPVDRSDLRNTIDPLTAWYDMALRLGRGERCTHTYRIWDGRRRFDLSMRSVGTETLKADRDWGYSGEAAVCEMSVKRLGGWDKDGDDPGNNPRVRDGVRVWFAPTPGESYWRPVRFSAPTAIGQVVGRIVNP